MEIPNLPTDNLYKFMATSGIIVVIVGFVMSYYGSKELNKEQNAIYTEYCILEFEINNLHKVDSTLICEIKELEIELKKYKEDNDSINELIDFSEIKEYYSNPEHRDLFVFIKTYENDLLPVREKYYELKQKADLREENELNIRKKEILLKERNRVWNEERNKNRILKWLWLFFTGSGTFLATRGFQLWYKKVQIHLDKKIKNEINEA